MEEYMKKQWNKTQKANNKNLMAMQELTWIHSTQQRILEKLNLFWNSFLLQFQDILHFDQNKQLHYCQMETNISLMY